MDRKTRKQTLTIAGLTLAAGAAGIVLIGRKTGRGPAGRLYNAVETDAQRIEKTYDFHKTKGQVVFLGGAGLRSWTELQKDFPGILVQNHGFRLRQEADFMNLAGRLVYPYEPSTLVFLMPLDSYAQEKGDAKEIADGILEDRKRLFGTMHIVAPDMKIVAVGGLPAPGRKDLAPVTERINEGIKAFAGEEGKDYLTFVDTSDFTDRKWYLADGHTLNRTGQRHLAKRLRHHIA